MNGCLLPVGTPGGVVSGFRDVPDGSGLVRLGPDMTLVEPTAYRLWRATRSAPAREELTAWARVEGIAEAPERIGSLEESGLIVGGDEHVTETIGRLAVKLTGECLGNGETPGPRFTVVGHGDTRVIVDLAYFDILLHADGLTMLSTVCEELHEAHPNGGMPTLLERFLEGLPMLVRSGVVRLDVAVRP